jgi:alcohol-forming fatty acyl-CoA reductase
MPDNVEKTFDVDTLIHPWPNAYTYSKAITEDVVRQFGKLIPAGVVRPSIIISTISGLRTIYIISINFQLYYCCLTDPLDGWCDNVYGINGGIVGSGAGLLRIMRVDTNLMADIIPADIVVNTILVAAYRRFHDTDEIFGKKIIPEPKVYNCVSCVDNPILWGKSYRID